MLGLAAKKQNVTCPCGADVPQKPGAGRTRKYCNPEHGRNWRRCMRVAGWL